MRVVKRIGPSAEAAKDATDQRVRAQAIGAVVLVLALAGGKDAGDVSHLIKVHPQAAHGVMHARKNLHGHVAGIVADKFLVDFENAFQLFVLDHEVDQMGTFNTTDVSASVFLSLVDRIAKAVESLHQAGVSKVVIGTDHGFLVLPRELRGDAPIKGIPGNQDTFKSWRFVIGKPPGDPTLISFSYEDLGLGSGGIARFPRSTHIFALRGTQDFFHGGISLQENCLLCITSVSKLEDLELVKVHVEVPEQLNPQDIPITLKPEHNVTRSPRSVIVEVLEGEKVLYQTPEHKIFVEPVHVHIALQETPQNLRIKVYDVDTYEVLFSETRDTISRGFDDFL